MDPRHKTWKLAQEDIDSAYKFAKGIDDVWYRVQSLSRVAWHISSKTRLIKIVDEALHDAKELKEPNRRVSVSAWAVRALAKRNDTEIESVVSELLEALAPECNPVRRADALLLLFEAVYIRAELRAMVLDPLLRACREMKSWKKSRILSDLALVIAEEDIEAAREIVDMINVPKKRRRASEEIDKGLWLGPHEFFPYFTKHPDREKTEK